MAYRTVKGSRTDAILKREHLLMGNGGFTDRIDAGRRLAEALTSYRGTDAVVLGLARGGVAVGYPVAVELQLPLHALVVRKIGAPDNPELAIGAVSGTGERWIDPAIAAAVGADEQYIEEASADEMTEARRREQAYGTAAGYANVRGRVAIVVDDGIATGASALVSLRTARALGAREVVLATPVASSQSIHALRRYADRVICLLTPEPFLAVGLHYGRFDQVSDDEVKEYLRDAARALEA